MKKKWLLWGFVVIALISSVFFDNFFVESLSKIRNFLLDEAFLGITFISSEIIIFLFLTTLFLWKEHKRKWVFPLWLTLGLSTLVAFLLKITVQRQRPFQLGIVSVYPFLEKSSHFIWNFSFPSFTTMFVFCTIPIISKEFPKIKWLWISFAILVGISRIYFGLHFLSDVIGGGLLGVGLYLILKRWIKT